MSPPRPFFDSPTRRDWGRPVHFAIPTTRLTSHIIVFIMTVLIYKLLSEIKGIPIKELLKYARHDFVGEAMLSIITKNQLVSVMRRNYRRNQDHESKVNNFFIDSSSQ